MKFPSVLDIATKNVIFLSAEHSISEAISLMVINNHRDVIVANNNRFFVITANDIVRLKLDGIDFSTPLAKITLEEIPKIASNKNILEALELVQQSKEYIIVVDVDGNMAGVLTNTDVITSIDPETLMENYRLGDLLKINTRMIRVSKDSPTNEVLKNFSIKDNDCVIVINEANIPEGILTTKDIVQILDQDCDLTLPMSTYMVSPVKSITEDATVRDAINFLQQLGFNRVVVTNNKGAIVGLINQKELISLSYSKWALLVKDYQTELKELNTMLESKADHFKKMAFTDSLTGLYNRYKLFELYDVERYSQSKRDGHMALAVCDIDYFKSINDKYGHTIGDHVLVKISNLLLACLRATDIIARWGGEEFVLILVSVSQENCEDILNKIADRIQNYQFEVDEKITISIGWTMVDTKENFDTVFKRADGALYTAKNNGRNQVKFLG